MRAKHLELQIGDLEFMGAIEIFPVLATALVSTFLAFLEKDKLVW